MFCLQVSLFHRALCSPDPWRSALLALHMPALGHHTRIDNENVSQRADATVKYITQIISTNMIERECLEARDPNGMSLWGLYFAYHICRLHMHSRKTCSRSAEIFKTLRETFVKIDLRWRIAGSSCQVLCVAYSDVNLGVYLELLEAHQAIDNC
jgi:hypothetical protein